MSFDGKGHYEWVDGKSDPFLLLTEERSGVAFPPLNLEHPVPYRHRDGMENRSLTGHFSYQQELRLHDERDLLEFFMKLNEVKGRLLNVLDWGCGEGYALDQMLELPCFDRGNSIGVTLPGTRGVHPAIEDRIVFGEVDQLRPIRFGNFDVLISILGANYYHTFDPERVEELDGYVYGGSRFALLQSLAQVSEGGVLIDSTSFQSENKRLKKFTDLLIAKRILRRKEGLRGNAMEVLRHPSREEIRELLLA